MTKSSTLQRTLVRFWVPLLLALIFYFANSAATDAFPGKEVNTAGNGNLAKTVLENHDEQEKLKKLLPQKLSVKKPIPRFPHIPIPHPVPRPTTPRIVGHFRPPVRRPRPPSFPKIP